MLIIARTLCELVGLARLEAELRGGGGEDCTCTFDGTTSHSDGRAGRLFPGRGIQPLRAKEPGIFDWQIGDGAVPRIGQTDGQWHNGAFGLLVSFGSDASGFRHISQTIAVEPGAKYRFELFYRSDIRSLGSLKWVIADAHSGAELAATRPLAAAGNWTETDADITVPDNIDGIVIRLDRDGSTGECTTSESIWFDDVSLKRR